MVDDFFFIDMLYLVSRDPLSSNFGRNLSVILFALNIDLTKIKHVCTIFYKFYLAKRTAIIIQFSTEYVTRSSS